MTAKGIAIQSLRGAARSLYVRVTAAGSPVRSYARLLRCIAFRIFVRASDASPVVSSQPEVDSMLHSGELRRHESSSN